MLQLACTVTVVPKFDPLIVNGSRWGSGTPATEDGVILLITGDGDGDGVGVGAVTVKLPPLDCLPSGFVTRSVQVSGVTSVAIVTSTRVEETLVTY